MENENLKPIEKLTPFTKMIMTIGTLPSSFYASMSYYESMIWLYEYLKNQVIPTVNNNAEAVEELQTAFTTLQNWIEHYFDNLNLQEEVNTKLDEMAEDGSLTNLIKAYVDPIYQAYESEMNTAFDGLSSTTANRLLAQDVDIANFKGTVNNQIAQIDTKVDSATSGSPLVASSTSGMTDTSRVYVNTTDGKWYYYDGDSWEIGGTYQSAEDSDEVENLRIETNAITDNMYNENLRLMETDGNYYISPEMFEIGNVAYDPSISPDLIYNDSTGRVRLKENFRIHLKANMIAKLTNGVIYGYCFEPDGTMHSLPWSNQMLLQWEGDYVFLLKNDPQQTLNDKSELLDHFSILPPSNSTNLNEKIKETNYKQTEINSIIQNNKFYDHLFLNKINGENVIIPLQSLESIYISKRLGFKIIEANVKETSDNKYIVTHGTNGKFGDMFYHTDGTTDISNTSINSVSLSYIQTYIRYKSLYDKYKTPPPTLEEYLTTCKKLNMIPLIQIENDSDVVEIANKIMGKDNYIAYNSTRTLNNGYIMKTGDETTTQAILNICNQYKPPFIYFMTNPSDFNDIDLKNTIELLHNKGYLIGVQDSYITPAYMNFLLNNKVDLIASTWNVNDFENGNITDVSGDISFNDFEGNGTTLNNNYTLTTGQYIRKWNIPVKFLAKSVVYIRFNGSLRVNMHSNYQDVIDIESTGNDYFRLSINSLNVKPEIMFTALSNTTIYDLKIKTSEC